MVTPQRIADWKPKMVQAGVINSDPWLWYICEQGHCKMNSQKIPVCPVCSEVMKVAG